MKTKSANTKSGYLVALEFKISQHSREAELMKNLVKYLDCGHYYPSNNRESGYLRVTRFSDIEPPRRRRPPTGAAKPDIIIPFFDKYLILGVKALDYADFCKVAKIIKNKEHTSVQGLNQIRLIKDGMNRERYSP